MLLRSCFSSPGWTALTQSTFPDTRCFSLLIVSVALCWTLSSSSIFHLDWAAQSWGHYSRCSFTSAEQRARLTSLSVLTTLLIGYYWPPLPQGTLLARIQLAVQQDLQVLPCEAACQHVLVRGVIRGTGLHTFLCWTSWGFCQPISAACWCLYECSTTHSTAPLSHVSSADLLRVLSALSSTSLMKILNSVRPVLTPGYSSSYWPPTTLCATDHNHQFFGSLTKILSHNKDGSRAFLYRL